MLLRNIIKNIDYITTVNIEEILDIEIEGISSNSKKIANNYIFVCLVGEHVDGHECAQDAQSAGAKVFVVERQLAIDVPQIIVQSTQKSIAQIAAVFNDLPSKKLHLIGVTGTNGKTTVTHLIQKLYEHFNKKCALIGTLGYKFSSDLDYRSCYHTTPQAIDLQKILSIAYDNGIDNVAMEVSSHALVQHRVDYIDFNGAVLTNLTQDHLDFHITMENYFEAKSILFGKLVAGDFAVINNDDEYADRFKNSLSKSVNLYTYGIKKEADVSAKDITFDSDGAKFTCVINNEEYKMSLKMNGMFSVYNVLAALTTAIALNFDVKESIKLLEGLAGVAGRFEIITTKPTVIVDYAHTPDGLENVLKAAREITPQNGKLICIFGCGGDRDATKRPKMGAIAENLADTVIVTSDNPRSEDPQQIITDILAGFKSVSNIIVEADRELAIREASKIATPNDVVLVAGKGHEDYQILADKTIHFDDREYVREIFVGA